ncbi:Cell wall-associated hydrolase, NlpC family [Micromonospora viridifaciens]|uniref:Cell wall-associated hydrolase, NlpC family n=1 Tax=Micromonospora viridifaciens TaxID=1881 RepID=A0A1C4UKF2_MICVI|nr:C40 family peptidase [Micromonospora viridifaciens]SCE72117.1 Cell wall-associated hydrolase, NlpC family [Micromonospora viridifaciens]
MAEPTVSISPAYRTSAPPPPTESKRNTRGPGRRGVIKLLLALAFIGGTLIGLGGLASAKASSGCSGSVAERAVCQAAAQKGDAYVWGGKGSNVFDCSGLTYYAYRKAGLDWSYRTAAGQYSYGVSKGKIVSTKNLRPGDLIFFNWDGGEIDHVGIYVGNGKMIHASSSRGKVVETKLNAYYRSHMLKSAVRPASGSANSNGGPKKKPAPTTSSKPTSKPKRSDKPYGEPRQIPVVIVPYAG